MRRPSIKTIALALFLANTGFMATGCEAIREITREDRKSAEEQYKLGLYYSTQEDKVDYAKANKWFLKAARNGHAGAQYMIGNAYLVGRGTNVYEDDAVYWLQKAAMQDHPRAMYLLGDLYYNGRAVEQDYAWGAMWFGKAARRGHSQAAMSLGIALAVGQGVGRNTPLAWAWVKEAEEQAHPDAERALQVLEVDMTATMRQRAEDYRARIRQAPSAAFYTDIPMIRYVQHSLNRAGHDAGPEDGLYGPQTKTAINSFRRDNGLEQSAMIDDSLIGKLRPITTGQES